MSVRRRPLPGPVLAAAVALAGPGLLGGCQAEEAPPTPPPTALQQALDSLPAETGLVRFVDRATVAARLGVDDLTGLETAADREAYDAAAAQAEWGVTEIGPWTAAMSRAGGFSELDLLWAARGVQREGASLDGWSVFRLEDSVNLGRVASALTSAGFTESEVAGYRRLAAPPTSDTGLVEDTYPATVLASVTLVPEAHLLVTGDPLPVLDVLSGAQPSLGDEGTFGELAANLPAVEYAELRTAGVLDCAAPLQTGKRPLTAAEIARRQQALGLGALGRPDRTALFVAVTGEQTRAVTLLQFADSESARSDAAARAAYLSKGIDPRTGQPTSDLYSIDAFTVEGDLETIEWSAPGGPAPGVRAHQAGAGVAVCVG